MILLQVHLIWSNCPTLTLLDTAGPSRSSGNNDVTDHISFQPPTTSNVKHTIAHEQTCTSSHNNSSSVDTSVTNNHRTNTDSESMMDVSQSVRNEPVDSSSGKCSITEVEHEYLPARLSQLLLKVL